MEKKKRSRSQHEFEEGPIKGTPTTGVKKRKRRSFKEKKEVVPRASGEKGKNFIQPENKESPGKSTSQRGERESGAVPREEEDIDYRCLCGV